jgi:hypothetical protein
MARSTRSDWFRFGRRSTSKVGTKRRDLGCGLNRRLGVEPLEDRRLLALVTVNTLTDSVDFNDGLTSLREAIFATNLIGGADTIDFAASLTSSGPATLTLTQGELKITDDLTIAGPGAELLTIDASGNDPTPDENNGDGSRVFNIDDGSLGTGSFAMLKDVSISGLTLTGADYARFVQGGAILSRENLTISDSVIRDNSSGSSGGGIAHTHGNLSVVRSSITENTAGENGGGIYAASGTTAEITASTIVDNQARYGGGIYKSGSFTLTDSTIRGNSAGSGGGISGSVLVTNSTISGNSAFTGGGIKGGIVTVIDSAISDNTANGSGGGIYSPSRVTVTNSTISGNFAGGGGGGIANIAVGVTVTNSTIRDNSAAVGGGIWTRGLSSITGSTVSGNTASLDGGGMMITRGVLTVTDSTISANSAREGGGIFSFEGALAVNNSTITGNSAGIVGGGIRTQSVAAVLNHTIVAGNMAGATFASNDVTGIVALAYSLLSVDAGATITDNGGNLIGTSASPIDPKLGPLADNGGLTLTHALLSGSPAINRGALNAVAGMNGVPQFDQRGQPFGRVIGGRIDVGAVESQPISPPVFGDYNQSGTVDAGDYLIWRKMLGISITPYTSADGNGDGIVNEYDLAVWRAHFGQTVPPSSGPSDLNLVVDTLDDESDGNYGLGDLSLREAILLANTYLSVDTISFSSTLTAAGPATIVLTMGELAITDSLTINGPGANLLTIDASGNDPTPNEKNGDGSRVFNIAERQIVHVDGSIPSRGNSIAGLTLTGGDAGLSGGGGAILVQSELTVANCTISGNSAIGRGGGIFGRGLTVINSTVSGNSAQYGGGLATSFEVGDLTVTGSTVSGNSAIAAGGGIFGSFVRLDDSTVSGNSAGSAGGGVFAAYDAFSRGGSLLVTSSTIHGNSSGSAGGGVFSDRSTVSVTESAISYNTARGFAGGGGIRSFGGAVVINNSAITGNAAIGPSFNGLQYAGGGVYSTGSLTIANSTISGNSSGGDGGGIRSNGGSLLVTDSAIADNSAGIDGGGLSRSYAGNVTLLRTVIDHNTAARWGGGIWHGMGSTVNIIDGTVSENSAALGGGIHNRFAVLTVTGSTISGNSAIDGAGIWNASSGPATHIVNSTISGNLATNRGGGIYNPGRLLIEFSTLTANSAPVANGGGIASGGFAGTRTELRSSIVAGNNLSDVDFVNGVFNSFVSLGFNLIGIGTGLPAFNHGGDQTGSLDPLLGPLADNGGPTFTHAILAGSPVINRGDLSAMPGVGGVPEFDQRGTPFARVFGGRIDIGAFEYQAASDLNLVVDTLVDESDGNYALGDLSLREALLMANTYRSADTIRFDPGLVASGPATITLTQGLVLARRPLPEREDHFRAWPRAVHGGHSRR